MSNKKLEIREHIVNHVKKYYANEVILLYNLMSKILLANNDFRLVKNAENDDLLSVIEKDIGENIDFPLESIIEDHSLAIYTKIDELDNYHGKLKKSERIGLIADVMSDDTLFEGFCLAFYGNDDELGDICNHYGCLERYLELLQDGVYIKRKKYMRMLTEYTVAATNLYGVIHIKELESLILEYEKTLDDKEYARIDGNYRNTIIYSPWFFGTVTMQQIIGDGMPGVFITLDGFVLHNCFSDAYHEEFEKMLNFFKGRKSEITEQDLASFYDTVSDTSFRILYEEASDKDIYMPPKNEFLKYVDDEYYEISLAEKQMRRYIEKKFLSKFVAVAKKIGISTSECINDFMEEIHYQATDVGKVGEERDPNELVQFVLDSINGYGVDFEDIDQANEFLSYAMKAINSVKLWCNHGYSPDELMRQPQLYPGDLTIVPGSSLAAKTLAEGREQLEQMGLRVDLDATATNISTLNFDNGINGTMTKGAKKVYPNDPCPCGSGKKYKRCCGK